MEIPPLPRNAAPHRIDLPPFQISLRQHRDYVRTPIVRGGNQTWRVPADREALNLALGLPIAIPGQNLQKLPKALGMRYTLQLVKATGENIRNLEILGVYQIPTRGVRSLRHDAKTGRVLLELGAEASGARLAPFIIARKKDEGSYVSSFVED